MNAPFEQESLDPKIAAEELQSLLLEELYASVPYEQFLDRNPNVTEDLLLERYVVFLERHKDLNIADISRILSLSIGRNRVDNVLEEIKKDRALRSQIQASLAHDGNELDSADGDKINPKKVATITNSLESYSSEELLLEVATKPVPKVLDYAASTSLGVNIALMMGSHSSTVISAVDVVKDKIGITANIDVTPITEISTAVVVALYLLQAGVQINDVGMKRYLRDNKLDTFFNITGVADLASMAFVSHESVAGVFRGLRALRGIKFLTKDKDTKTLLTGLKSAVPSLAKLSGAYVGFSSIITLILVTLLGPHAEEFKDMETAFSQMLSLFYGEGFPDVMAIIDEVGEEHPLNASIAKPIALGYMPASVVGIAGVLQSIIINQVVGTDRVERIVSYLSETVGEGFSKIERLIKENLGVSKKVQEELSELRAMVESDEREKRISNQKQRRRRVRS